MNKQWCLMSLIIVGLWSVGNRTFAETTPEEAEEPDERNTYTVEQLTVIHERGVKLIRLLDHGRFVLAGRVVDQEGKPLPDVSLRFGMRQMKGWGWNPSKDIDVTVRDEVLKDGLFRVDVSPYYSVSFHFEKEGYYPEELYYRFNYQPENEAEREERVIASERIMRGEEAKVKEGVVRDENIRVVMEKKGVVMEPVVYGGPLLYAPGYGGTTAKIVYIDFSIPPQKDYKLKSVPSLAEVTNIPQYTVYAIADTDAEGRVAHELLTTEYYDRPEAYVRKVHLRLNDPNGGFVEYEQGNREQAFWSMKQAPENGYNQELLITPEKVIKRINAHETGGGGIYFYFKVGGRYGKGSIGQIDVKNGGETVRIFIAFMVQPDGSRNVDTGRQIL